MPNRGWPSPTLFGLGYGLIIAALSGLVVWQRLNPDLINATVPLIGLAAFHYQRRVYLGLMVILFGAFFGVSYLLVPDLLAPLQTILIASVTITTICEIVRRMVEETDRTNQALKASEERLRLLLSSAEDIIYMQDRDGRYLYTSGASSAHLFPNDVLGKTPADLYPPETAHGFIERLRQVMETGQSLTHETHLPADGMVHIFNDCLTPVKDEQDRIFAVLTIARDVTRAKAAEQKTQESENRYRSLFNLITDPILLIDVESGLVIDCNHAAELIYGYTRAELLQMSPVGLIAPENRDHFHSQPADLDGPVLRRAVHQARSGHQLQVEIYSQLMDIPGRSIRLSIIRDITERTRQEKIQTAIYQIAQAALSVENMTDLYSSVHQILGRLLHAENYFIALYDLPTDTLTFPYFVDTFDPTPGPHRGYRGLTEYVVRTGQPLLATPEVFEELARIGEVESVGTPSLDWMGVPLIVGSQTIGVMVVQTYREDVRYDQEDKQILTFVSSQVAMAIDRKKAEERLRETEQQYRLLVEQVNAVMYTDAVDYESSTLYIAPQVEALTGYSSDEWINEKNLWLRLIHPEDLERVLAENNRTNQTREPFSVEYRILHKDGRIIWVDDQAVMVCDEYGSPYCWQGVMRDITDRKVAEARLRQSEANLAEAQELAHLGSFQLDHALNIRDGSAETFRIFGFVDRPWPGSMEDLFTRIHPDDREPTRLALIQAVQENQPFNLEYRVLMLDGGLKYLHSMGQPAEDGNEQLYFGTVMDITERKRTEEKLWLLSTHDALTGLYNRAYFEEQIRIFNETPIYPLSIMMMDVDGLKRANDSLGHAAGDELLRRAAQVLRASFRKQDVIARIGGDEFAALLPGVDESSAAEGLSRIRRILREQSHPTGKYPLDFSVGMATGNTGSPVELVMRQADEQMYLEKGRKRG